MAEPLILPSPNPTIGEIFWCPCLWAPAKTPPSPSKWMVVFSDTPVKMLILCCHHPHVSQLPWAQLTLWAPAPVPRLPQSTLLGTWNTTAARVSRW